MKTNLINLNFIVSCLLLSLLPLIAVAQKSELSGEIKLEKEEKGEAPYTQTENAAIKLFEELNSFIENPASATFDSSVALPERVLVLLNALYLQCSVNRGTCAQVLDALLEVDLIESLRTSNVQCKNMQKFWSLWLQNDMEKRHQYQVKTGYLQSTSEFKNKVRPAYIKCVATIKNQIESDAVDNLAFFKARYQEGSTVRLAVSEVLSSLKSAQRSKVNLITATGGGK